MVFDFALASRPEIAKRDGAFESRLTALVTQVGRTMTAMLVGTAAPRTRIARHRPCNNSNQLKSFLLANKDPPICWLDYSTLNLEWSRKLNFILKCERMSLNFFFVVPFHGARTIKKLHQYA